MVRPKNHTYNFPKKHRFLIVFSALGIFLYFVIIFNNQGAGCFIDCDGESSITNSSDEKFMTYLPHSGFHNQRISLENAIFIAWYLNRTLVIPPIFYFNEILPFGKRPFDRLYSLLSKLTPKKNTYLHCKSNGRKKKCTKVTYTLYNWEELMDFRFVKRNVRIIHRADFHYEHLLQSLKISPGDKGQ
ncbi:16770_t:CDS:1, partial [Acaulospora morrowiae]